MFENNECISCYQKLLELLDEDASEMELCLQGEILAMYHELIKREQDILRKAISMLNN